MTAGYRLEFFQSARNVALKKSDADNVNTVREHDHINLEKGELSVKANALSLIFLTDTFQVNIFVPHSN